MGLLRLFGVKAKAPALPTANDATMQFMPAMGNTLAKSPILDEGTSGIDELERSSRIIRNDPRESFYWTLPFKLTPQQCLNMLRAALAGDLFQQYNLSQLMLDTWPTFRMASHQLMEGAAYMRYAVHPFAEEGQKPTASAKERADLVSRAMRGMNPNPFNDEKGFSGMAYTLCDAMINGLSLVELLWELRPSPGGREWMPASAAWVHPRHYTFDTTGTIALYGDDAERIGSYSLNRQRGNNPSPEYFICGQFMSKSGSVLGAGFMRPLVWYWSARQFNNEWMLNTAKQYGSAFIEMVYKPEKLTAGPNGELAKLNAMLESAGSQRRLIHPEGTVATIHPPTSLGADNPQRVLEEKADEACLFLLLGQKGTTVGTAGSLGDDSSREKVKEERMLGLAHWLARNPLRQFARAVLIRNYGNADECPNIEPDTTKPLKPEQVSTLMTAVTSSRVPVRADEFYKKIGFTQPDAGEVVIAGGELSIQGESLTDEERFEQGLGKQVKQAEAQMNLSREAASPVEARTGDGFSGHTVRSVLAQATEGELIAIEAAAAAAESAPHLNGEAELLKAELAKAVSRIERTASVLPPTGTPAAVSAKDSPSPANAAGIFSEIKPR
jgi:phage gp29-like protein